MSHVLLISLATLIMPTNGLYFDQPKGKVYGNYFNLPDNDFPDLKSMISFAERRIEETPLFHYSTPLSLQLSGVGVTGKGKVTEFKFKNTSIWALEKKASIGEIFLFSQVVFFKLEAGKFKRFFLLPISEKGEYLIKKKEDGLHISIFNPFDEKEHPSLIIYNHLFQN